MIKSLPTNNGGGKTPKKKLNKTTNKTPKKKLNKTTNKTTVVVNKQPDVNELTPRKLWYLKYFKENYANFPMIPKIRDHINDTTTDANLLYGSYNRIHAYIAFGLQMKIDIVNSICITFKLKDLSDDTEAIFAFGYYEDVKSKKIADGDGLLRLTGTDIAMRYIMLGGSFISKDGEYRNGCISSENIRSIDRYPIYNIIDDIKRYLNEQMRVRKFVITKEYFYPTDDKKIMETNLEYYTFNLQMTILSLSWVNLMNNVYLNILENNLNDKYKKLMLKNQKEDLEYFKILLKKYPKENMDTLRSLVNHVQLNKKRSVSDTTKIGQKIIPLSISEAQNPFNIQYKPWREYLISVYLSDYIINNISPGFFITNQWFYIKNSRKGLFDNEIQYEKMSRSELAEQITMLLSRAQLYTCENISSSEKIIKKRQRVVDSWLSEKFKILHGKIKDPIDFAKEEIIMSNVALGIMSEYVGRTIMDVVHLCKVSPYYNKLVGYPFSAQGCNIFDKYMFDMCYNLYCMNKRGGIMHGDLHLNNSTIRPTVYRSIRDIENIKNPTVLYALGDENEQYLLPTKSYNLCLIDFSRCLVLPDDLDKFHDKSLPKSYNILPNLKEFQEDQVDRLLQLYIHYTTESIYSKDDLYILFKNKFEAVFKLLSVTDIYGFTQKLLTVFKIKNADIITPHKNVVDLIQKINTTAERYITIEMNKLISDPAYETYVNDMEWPIYTIIKQCFSNYLVANQDVGNIVEVYNINNKLQYSLNTSSQFPPELINNQSVVNGKVINDPKLKQDINTHTKSRVAYEQEKMRGMKVVNYIATRQREKHI